MLEMEFLDKESQRWGCKMIKEEQNYEL